MLSEDQLQNVFPYCRDTAQWVKPLTEATNKFEIRSSNRLAAFLGQLGVESAELNRLEEALSYSPRRLQEVSL